jgi:hypothetical protein
MASKPSTPRPIASYFDSEPSALIYETRFTAFLDVLGWKDLIERSRSDPGLAGRMAKLIEHGANLDLLRRNIASAVNSDDCLTRVSQFSDSIILSRPSSDFLALFIVDVCLFQIYAIYHGFLVRGGIAVGELHHGDHAVFGPALVSAYRLESEIALYPRIVLDEQMLPFFELSHNPGLSDFIIKDPHDGIYYLNFLKFPFEKPFKYEEMSLDQLWTFFRQYEQAFSHDPGVGMKMKWLFSYWNIMVARYSPAGLRDL